MQTAAVIGFNSMLGARLVTELAALGVKVLSVGRGAAADIKLDLESGFSSSLPAGAQADVVFHCAASFADDSPEGLRKNFLVNTAGCLWVLELAAHLRSDALIYAGSVFSHDASDPAKVSSYGFTKAKGEELLAWGMRRLGRRFCSLRFSQLYDTAGACIRHQPWFGRIIAYAANGADLNMPRSDGVRNFLHLDDAVRTTIAAGRSAASGILDVVSPESLTLEEIAAKAYTVFGKGGNITIDAAKSPFRLMHFPDGALAIERLGVKPEISILQGIAAIRDNGTWPAFGPLDVK